MHYSWLIIALLVAFSLGGHFQMVNPEWGTRVIWTMAIVTALLFFAGNVTEEMVQEYISHHKKKSNQDSNKMKLEE